MVMDERDPDYGGNRSTHEAGLEACKGNGAAVACSVVMRYIDRHAVSYAYSYAENPRYRGWSQRRFREYVFSCRFVLWRQLGSRDAFALY